MGFVLADLPFVPFVLADLPFVPFVLADLQSASIEYKHLQCDNLYVEIANPYILNGRIANPPERGNKTIVHERS